MDKAWSSMKSYSEDSGESIPTLLGLAVLAVA